MVCGVLLAHRGLENLPKVYGKWVSDIESERSGCPYIKRDSLVVRQHIREIESGRRSARTESSVLDDLNLSPTDR